MIYQDLSVFIRINRDSPDNPDASDSSHSPDNPDPSDNPDSSVKIMFFGSFQRSKMLN